MFEFDRKNSWIEIEDFLFYDDTIGSTDEAMTEAGYEEYQPFQLGLDEYAFHTVFFVKKSTNRRNDIPYKYIAEINILNEYHYIALKQMPDLIEFAYKVSALNNSAITSYFGQEKIKEDIKNLRES